MTTRQAVVDEAKSWLGTPYHLMAKVKGAGVDCGQLLIEVFSNVGITPHIDTGHYPSDWHFHRSEEKYLGWVKQYAKPVDVPQAGDVALFKYGRCISHGAIVIEWPLMIHAHLGHGVVYVDANDSQVKGRLAGFFTVFKD